ncbi:30S ribosomal protein S1 [Candidatus Magnetominusculus dajiuhuensis]|uniref:30S ribosomal protein S1 n=1 Tax=Candidatus Magnetominusculus dajiuhuensis TaxID=3137712 RepID=UPI003B437984
MEVQNSDLEQLYAGTFRSIESGMIMTGKVISKKSDAIVVDIGYKSEGFIPIDDFTQEELDELKEGSDIEVLVSSIRDSEGTITLSKSRAKILKTQKMLQQSFDEGAIIEGKIVERTKGGFFVDVAGVKAFLPGSHYDVRPLRAADDVVGQQCRFKVLKLNNKLNNVIVSRRAVIEEEKKKKKTQTLSNIKEGVVVKGAVKNVTDYGVFIDLGEIDGLLHISDISWGRINHPTDYFNVGDEVEVLVLKYDQDSEKVTLGYKQKKSDPWLDIETRYTEGKLVTGKVVGITDYGAFIELEEGVEGLVHVSELDWSARPGHPSKYLEIGDSVDVAVLKIENNQRRISLGIKQLKPKPWELVAERYAVGQKVSGKVRTITDFGVFVGMPEGIDALIHISDIFWTKHIKHPSEVFKLRQKVEAVVLSLEPEKKRMLLGVKQLKPDPWTTEIPQRFKIGSDVSCKVLRVSEYGLFVEIEDSVEGLVYASEIIKNAEEDYVEGSIVQARIIKLDFEQRKIGLSMVATSDSRRRDESPDKANEETTDE